MQDILEAVLNDPGVEQSAHEVMRQELDEATRLDRLVPMHEHLCQLEARTRYRSAVASSGLDPTDTAALQASRAYGALIAELRRAESIDLSVSDLLCRAVAQSPLTNARDIAAVLHGRVERLVRRSQSRTRRPITMVAGLVIPARQASDPTMLPALRELESQIADRADWLARQAATERPLWYEAIAGAAAQGREPTRLIREIAAYRERYQVREQTVLGATPPQAAIGQRQHHARLLTQIRRISRDDAEQSDLPSAARAPTMDVGANFASDGPRN